MLAVAAVVVPVLAMNHRTEIATRRDFNSVKPDQDVIYLLLA